MTTNLKLRGLPQDLAYALLQQADRAAAAVRKVLELIPEHPKAMALDAQVETLRAQGLEQQTRQVRRRWIRTPACRCRKRLRKRLI